MCNFLLIVGDGKLVNFRVKRRLLTFYSSRGEGKKRRKENSAAKEGAGEDSILDMN